MTCPACVSPSSHNRTGDGYPGGVGMDPVVLNLCEPEREGFASWPTHRQQLRPKPLPRRQTPNSGWARAYAESSPLPPAGKRKLGARAGHMPSRC